MDIHTLLTRINTLHESVLQEAMPGRRATGEGDKTPATRATSRQHVKQDRKQAATPSKPDRVGLSKADRTKKFGHKFANKGTFGATASGALQVTPGLRQKIPANQFAVRDQKGKKRNFPVVPKATERARAAGSLRQTAEVAARAHGGPKNRHVSYATVKSAVKRNANVLNMLRPSGPTEKQGKHDARPHGKGGMPPSSRKKD